MTDIGQELNSGTEPGLFSRRRIFYMLSLISAAFCFIFTCLHYTNILYGNQITWIGWILSMLFLLAAFSPSMSELSAKLFSYKNTGTLLILFLSALFIGSHLFNFNTAPWNYNGLFDDAAWDIFFSKKYLFSDQPFQIAFFDEVGYISREAVFHYYITFFFKLFGYNLLTFNISLLLLGFVTYLSTLLIIHKLFNNPIVTSLCALVFNFFPLHFLQTFAGHRYSIAAPLMLSSLYFLYTGYQCKSPFRITLSAILTALSVQSAVMGKQYLAGLAGTLVLLLIFNFKKVFTQEYISLTIKFVMGLLIALIPLILYVYYNPVYFAHEKDLSAEFFNAYKTGGFEAIKLNYWDRLISVLFGEFTYYRWFNPEFVTLPYYYCLFLVPGIFLAFLKKHYEFILLAFIPIAGAFVSGTYDMRLLHAVPFWIILMAFTINAVLNLSFPFKNVQYIPKLLLWGLSFCLLLGGLVPSAKYLYEKSTAPLSIRLLPQKDVALSRFVRDIVAGVPQPLTTIRKNEFNKLKGIPEPNYDTLVCQDSGYAITHMFLQDYQDKKVLSFSDQLPAQLLDENQLLQANINAIRSYENTGKDLKLVWEISGKTTRIIEKFKPFASLGSDETLTGELAGSSFSLYVLNIKNSNLESFKNKAAELTLN